MKLIQPAKLSRYALPLLVFVAVIIAVIVIAKHIFRFQKTTPRPVVAMMPPQYESPDFVEKPSTASSISASSEFNNEQPASFSPSGIPYSEEPVNPDAAEYGTGVGLPAYERQNEQFAYV